MNDTPRSVYRLGAEDGLLMAPMLILVALLFGASTYYTWLGLPAMVAAIGVPALAYWLLARTYARQPELSTFSALWLQGICTFFFGSLIMAVVVYLAMRFMCPTFIVDQFNTVIAVYSQIDEPAADTLVSVLQRALNEHQLPTPMDVTLELVYIIVFTGSILSMFLSLIIRRRGRNQRFPEPPKFNNDI